MNWIELLYFWENKNGLALSKHLSLRVNCRIFGQLMITSFKRKHGMKSGICSITFASIWLRFGKTKHFIAVFEASLLIGAKCSYFCHLKYPQECNIDNFEKSFCKEIVRAYELHVFNESKDFFMAMSLSNFWLNYSIFNNLNLKYWFVKNVRRQIKITLYLGQEIVNWGNVRSLKHWLGIGACQWFWSYTIYFNYI